MPTPTEEVHETVTTTTHIQDKGPSGLIDKLFDRMPSWQRTMLLLFIIPPMTLAISGLLLQVNVGGILNRYIDYMYENTKRQTVDIDGLIKTQGEETAKAIFEGQLKTEESLTEMRLMIENVMREVTASTARMDTIERQTQDHGARLGRIERYICDNDKALGFGACVLDKEDRIPNGTAP